MVKRARNSGLVRTLLCGILIAGCPSVTLAETRHPYFGELHLHTNYSLDAYVFGTNVGADEALRYARGETVQHPGGFNVRLRTPLDFAAVTDHAEYTGALAMAQDPESALRQDSPMMASFVRFGTWLSAFNFYRVLAISIVQDMPFQTLQGDQVAGKAWRELTGIADAYYQPGKFTTFAGWEWTATPDFKNLHRIVLFKDPAHTPANAFSSIDSTEPTALWQWMDGQLAQGNEVLAITHNGNLSNGALYPRRQTASGKKVDHTYAANRMVHEPVAEITQVKGQSETTLGLSPGDEFADFNTFVWLLLGASGTPTDYGSYLRLALRDGIAMQGALGFNPYKVGFVSGSDSHSAVSAYRHDEYFGEHSLIDDTPEERLAGVKLLNLDNREISPAGLTGVWAEANDRDSLWKGIRRKETFATSGLRMPVRFFGGWQFDRTTNDFAELSSIGYEQGVPMGADLPARAGDKPTFLVWAGSDSSGPDLDRIQIVKGWAQSGQSFERVYDVVWAGDRKPISGRLPSLGNTVNPVTATYENTIGEKALLGSWTDEDFDPGADAFYYLRVLAIPTPRWTTIDAVSLGVDPPTNVPLFQQDRAWSSPIWYKPSSTDRRKLSVTVAELIDRGAQRLDSAALEERFRGRTIKVSNLVANRNFDIQLGHDGYQSIVAVDGRPASDEERRGHDMSASIKYEFSKDSVAVSIGGAEIQIAVFQHDGRYLAARSDEYGFVNYEWRVLP